MRDRRHIASGTAPLPPSAATENARLSWTLLLAAALATLGVLRLCSDILTDIDPTLASYLGDSPLRYLARRADGPFVANLNTQYFKVMAVPCGLAGIFLISGGLTGGIAAAEKRWANPRFRLGSIVGLAVVCACCEIEKATHLLGLPTGLVEGEQAWLNHVVHNVGAILAYPLSSVLRYRAGAPGPSSALPNQDVRSRGSKHDHA